MNEFELTGRSREHIVELQQPPCALHYEAASSFLAMREAAAAANIDLIVVSSFRDFDTQLSIWNRKWRGERPLYARDGTLLHREALAEAELVDAILSWSAIPGGSRHHWGSDLDLADAAAAPGYRPQLVPEEYAPQGVFARLAEWLEGNARRFGFFRPYRSDRGGVMPEPWHYSYAPVAAPALESLSLAALRRILEASPIEGKQQVLMRLPEIYTRFLLAIDPP